MVEHALESRKDLTLIVERAEIVAEETQRTGAPIDQPEVPLIHRVEHPAAPELAQHGHVAPEMGQVRENRRQRDDVLELFVRLEDGALERLLEVRDDIASIAAEDLVATLATQHDLHLASRRSRDHVLRQQAWPRDRFIHVIDQARK